MEHIKVKMLTDPSINIKQLIANVEPWNKIGTGAVEIDVIQVEKKINECNSHFILTMQLLLHIKSWEFPHKNFHFIWNEEKNSEKSKRFKCGQYQKAQRDES